MSVPVPKRDTGELEVNTAARQLCVYTLQITGNPKHFDQAHADVIALLRRYAIEIHALCWRANNIKVTCQSRYEARMTAQDKAADLCNDLYAMIEVCKPLFHMASKRKVYWQGLVVKTRNLIRGWHDTDVKRLKPEG